MKRNIALIDDDKIALFLNRAIITKTYSDPRINAFCNAQEALKFLKVNAECLESLPDIVLLDLYMPVMDGWEFVEEYKKFKAKLCKKIELFLLSSSIAHEDISRAKSTDEISDYIIKPLSTEKIKEIIGGPIINASSDHKIDGQQDALSKAELIKFILRNSQDHEQNHLNTLGISDLVIYKVEIELKMQKNKNKTNN